jgi:7,8-dihydropterin-6-yl-methyl-4-(beta-D-ribofuranosyl)aminobenzene 5'-phosphate synthase
MITLTLLVENTARGLGVLGEHGLAWWIDTGTHRVLFDTGQGMALFNNARRLGVDLSSADAIVLSHGHADHVGGLEQVLAVAKHATLFFHPRATEQKFTGSDRKPAGRRLSIDFLETEAFKKLPQKIVATDQSVEVVPGMWTSGEIPRANDFEDTGGPFFLDEAMTRADPLLDDLSVFIPTTQGTIVVFGCAHAGSINTLRHISTLTQGAPVRALFGGLHLENASARRIDETVSALKACRPHRMGFCHCTGFQPLRRLWNEFPSACVQTHAGSRFDFSN